MTHTILQRNDLKQISFRIQNHISLVRYRRLYLNNIRVVFPKLARQQQIRVFVTATVILTNEFNVLGSSQKTNFKPSKNY